MATLTDPRACHCPPDATETLDDVTITGHTSPCPHLPEPRLYVWQDFDVPGRLETGNLHDFAETWALSRDRKLVPGAAVDPIEIRTWDASYKAQVTEQSLHDEETWGLYRVTVDHESVTVHVYLAERLAAGS